jgi:pteridine reductase
MSHSALTDSPVALVTGSGKRRIGWHVAQALAARGYRLAVHYRSSATEGAETVASLRGRGVDVIAWQADVASEDDVRKMIDGTVEHFGRIDVLVCCASIYQRKRFEDVTAADVRRNFDVNTLGTFLCCQRAGLAMVKQPEGGCIVTVADWAIERPYLNYSAYLTSKGTVPALTRILAVELGTRNPRVRVNCLLPGPVMFPPDLPLAEKEQSIRATLLKREGTPENIAQAVLALIDNDFITGVVLAVDGGRSIYAPE